MDHEHRHEPGRGNGTKSRIKWVFIGFLVIAAYFLITEHRAHLSGFLYYLPFLLLLLACPLMHIFMHGGHSHGGSDSAQPRRKGDDRE